MDKKINKLLNDVLKEVEKIDQSGVNIIAGRIVPTPSNKLKPKVVIKPKDKK
ncbi:hypothetical protein [Flavobacterium daejeonense]|uniref:hypothetical protein n=1 Tax=Flavobacterium daejeonense TaxID=350893 RepID=UPI000AD28CDF|nr:hypothetical protein [Flavobacterium daejeonense]